MIKKREGDMKKNILFVVMFMLTIFSIQAKDEKKELVFPVNEAGKIIYTEVIEMPNLTKDILYTRAYEWFAKSFNDAKNVIQMQDKEAGRLIGKGSFGDINVSINFGLVGVKGNVNFTISVYLKDGKYKYEITDFVHEGVANASNGMIPTNGGALESEKPECGRNYLPLGKWKNIKEQTNERVLALIESLKKAMIVESVGNNW
jgi:hypothetical protein